MIEILLETAELVVVAKPSGIAVHRSKHVGDRIAMLQLVRDAVGCRVHPAHRIDRATSGCLIFTKSGRVHTLVADALAKPTAEKRYWALLRGVLDAPVDEQRPLRKKGKGPTGPEQEARTVITPLAHCSEPRCTLVEARIYTGRFHQIRRHAAGLSHPVLGDSSHGDTRENRLWREQFGLGRLALHCHHLRLDVDEIGTLDVRCPLPADLAGVLDALPIAEAAAKAMGRDPGSPPASGYAQPDGESE